MGGSIAGVPYDNADIFGGADADEGADIRDRGPRVADRHLFKLGAVGHAAHVDARRWGEKRGQVGGCSVMAILVRVTCLAMGPGEESHSSCSKSGSKEPHISGQSDGW